LYVENYDAGDYTDSMVFGLIADAAERHFFTEYVVGVNAWQARLPDGNVLQARGSYFYPGRAMMYHAHASCKHAVLLEATDCVGTHKVFREGTVSYPVLVQHDRFHAAAMNLSQFDPLKQLPFFRWRAVFALLFAEVLKVSPKRVEVAFDAVWQPIQTRGITRKRSGALRPADLEQAVERAVSWHLHSGVMPERSGRKGCFEMIRSQNLRVRANLRMDAQLLAGLLLTMQGIRKSDRACRRRGEALVRHMLDAGIQVERGYAKGFFKWFEDFGDGPDVVYANDTPRGGLVMLKMQALTGQAEYLDRATALGDAILHWLGEDGRHNVCFKISAVQSMRELWTKGKSEDPRFYAEMAAFLLQLHRVTAREAYRDAVLKFARPMVACFPDLKAESFSANFLYGRFLLMACCLQEMLGEDCSRQINLVLDHLERLQHPSGGIAEPAIRLLRGAEAGVGIGDGSDAIADLLYCNNFSLCALGILVRTRHPFTVNMAQARALHRNLLRFLVNAQIVSDDPRLDGGWMRAYDLAHREYYGLNKDKDWGPYCIMGGWVMGYIPLAFLHELGEPALFV
jgi:hypothetical protein